MDVYVKICRTNVMWRLGHRDAVNCDASVLGGKILVPTPQVYVSSHPEVFCNFRNLTSASAAKLKI
jgi:hypothetical protein